MKIQVLLLVGLVCLALNKGNDDVKVVNKKWLRQQSSTNDDGDYEMNIDQTKLKVKGCGSISLNGNHLTKATKRTKGGLQMNVQSHNGKMNLHDNLDIHLSSPHRMKKKSNRIKKKKKNKKKNKNKKQDEMRDLKKDDKKTNAKKSITDKGDKKKQENKNGENQDEETEEEKKQKEELKKIQAMKIRRLDQSKSKKAPSSPRQYLQSKQKQYSQTYDDLQTKFSKSKKKKQALTNTNQNVKDKSDKKEKNEQLGDDEELDINYSQIDPHVVYQELEKQGIDLNGMRFKQMQSSINRRRQKLNKDVEQFNNMLVQLSHVQDKQKEFNRRMLSRKI